MVEVLSKLKSRKQYSSGFIENAPEAEIKNQNKTKSAAANYKLSQGEN